MDKNEAHKEIDLFEYWKVIIKRKGLIIAFTSALVLLTGVFSFLVPPKFRATATLLIDEEASKMLSIEDSFGNPSRVYQDLRFFNTQLKLLKSKSLVEKVARKLNLLSRAEYKSRFDNSGNEKAKPRSSVDPYSLITREIIRDIGVRQLRETKLVELSCGARLPELAAEIVNTLAEEFMIYSTEKRYETTQQASDFLGEQIANLRGELTAEEQELQKYGQEKDLFFLSDTQSTTGNKFADLNQAYNQAIIVRVNAESAYREIKDLDVDSIPQFVNNPVVQALRTDYMRAKNDYDEKIKKFKPDYPEMVQLAARLESMRTDLRRAVNTAEAEFQSALNKEYSLKALLEKQKVDLAKMNQNAILYNNLKIEVETKRRLYNSLVERQNQTLVSSRLSGLKSSNISIIDRAEIPRFPVSPRKKMNLMLALLLGLFGGVGLSFFAEYLDNSIKGAEDVERLVGLPSLGVVPHFETDKSARNPYENHLILDDNPARPAVRADSKSMGIGSQIDSYELNNYHHPGELHSEYFRSIRTSIMFSSAGKPMKCIVITSAMAQEGKTSTVTNLAVSFSQLKEKVLLIEADMRRPRLHRIFKVRRIKGLSNYLAGQTPLIEAIQPTSIDNIWVLACGPIPPNPAELLNSQKMKDLLDEAKQIFDIILIDTPPLLAVVDPFIVASLADGVALVVHGKKTARKPFARAVGELKKYNTNIIGVILNDMRMSKNDIYYRDYYHSGDSSHPGRGEETSPS